MNIALILAGGSGTRLGGSLPKQYQELAGKPALVRTISAFQQQDEIDEVYLVCAKNWVAPVKMLVQKYALEKVTQVLTGGADRRESSFLGLSALIKQHSPEDIVLIHDGARPLVSSRIITDCIDAAQKWPASTTAIPVQDTILDSEEGEWVSSIPERSRLYAVQTPQTFRLGVIYQGHLALPPDSPVTDDAGILAAQGISVHLVEGDKRNLKLTTQEDLEIARIFLGR